MPTENYDGNLTTVLDFFGSSDVEQISGADRADQRRDETDAKWLVSKSVKMDVL